MEVTLLRADINNAKELHAMQVEAFKELFEYYGAVTPQIRQAGNRLSGLTETACASLLA